MKISKKLYDVVVFYLETLYEGCDLTEQLVDEISSDNSRIYKLLSKFKGRNVEDVRDTILRQLRDE